MKSVNIQFKILYALGIFFIVCGHYFNGGVDILFNWFKPYSFHIGLFVFCSGYFYLPESEEHPGTYVCSRVKKLLIPLYLWNLFYGLLVLLLNAIGFSFPITFNWYTLLISPINNGHQFSFNLASWFIFPLFMIQIFTLIVRKLLKRIKIKNEIAIFSLLMLIGMFGVQMAANGYYTGWWLVLTRFCYFLPFYAIGRLYKVMLEEKLDKIRNLLYFGVVFAIQSLIMIMYEGAFAYTPSRCDNFDNCIVPFLIGFTGIAFWVRCAKLLVPIVGHSRVMMLVADNTFSIMMHHFLGLFVLKSFFAILKYFGIACSSFDLHLFTSDVQYGYIPFGIHPFAVFMVLGSIGFSILFGKLPGLIKRLICK